MREQRVKFQTAELAKEKGFEQNGSKCWVQLLSGDIIHNDDREDKLEHERTKYYLTQPTQSTLQKWLREEHKIDVLVMLNMNDEYSCHIFKWHKSININKNIWEGEGVVPQGINYEAVLEEGLQEGLKLI